MAQKWKKEGSRLSLAHDSTVMGQMLFKDLVDKRTAST